MTSAKERTKERVEEMRYKARTYKVKLDQIGRLMGKDKEYYQWRERTLKIKQLNSMYFAIDKKLEDLGGYNKVI